MVWAKLAVMIKLMIGEGVKKEEEAMKLHDCLEVLWDLESGTLNLGLPDKQSCNLDER